MDQRIDVFCHILPARFEKARWDRFDRTHFAEHSPSHLKYMRGGKAPLNSRCIHGARSIGGRSRRDRCDDPRKKANDP